MLHSRVPFSWGAPFEYGTAQFQYIQSTHLVIILCAIGAFPLTSDAVLIRLQKSWSGQILKTVLERELFKLLGLRVQC